MEASACACACVKVGIFFITFYNIYKLYIYIYNTYTRLYNTYYIIEYYVCMYDCMSA